MEAEHSVRIERPAEYVFAFLARPENHPRFAPGVLEFHAVDGPMAEGARLAGTRKVFGLVRHMPYRVSGFEPNRTLELQTSIGPLTGSGTYVLEPHGSATVVRFIVAGGFRGPLRVADRLLARTLQRDAAAVCANLKRVLETAPAELPL